MGARARAVQVGAVGPAHLNHIRNGCWGEDWKLTRFLTRAYVAGVCSKSNHFDALRAKETRMKTLVMLALVAVIGTAVIGCKAKGEVDTDTATSITAPR